ncbi:protein of unknown function [Acidithiobacillus ferrivorans]|uniref:Uncharacterized protein n=1 Tax=Acidithiobacillus ferrivorans TaxID=160808 RepID=A0A060UVT3_9PROT|nr:hypothetical protein [Acidithiobacillus ferrivorans]CDQ10679.1 hypothetical protein AFERRI_400460 [Acidithiobacillus ferrivorans]SMH64705.1 protein of unknown function [Acidithiobacillus ferrivorans]
MKKVLILTRHTDALARAICQNIPGDEMVTAASPDHIIQPSNFSKYDTFNGECRPERHYHIKPKLTISRHNNQSVRRKYRKA